MNILFFSSMYKIGLSNQLAEQTLAFANNSDHKFTFVAGDGEQYPGLLNKLDERNINYKIIHGLDRHSSFFRLVGEFEKIVKNEEPVFVVVQTNWQLAVAVATKYQSNAQYRVVYVVHGYRANYRFRSFIARYLILAALKCFASHVVTPCVYVKNKFRLLGHKNRVVFFGEDSDLFDNYPLPVFSGTKRFVFPGAFRIGKNQEMVIRVISRYIEITGDKDIELHLPGMGEKLEKCRNLCRKLGIADKVFFPGFIDRKQMLELYLKCQYAVISSNVETFGHCIAEPFILGRAVITRRVGVADDIIRHGETGFCFDGEEDLLNLLLRILPDRTLCEQVARNARNSRDQFRWDVVCRQYFDLIFDPPAETNL
jgi:glycosyltransferase involved in cell wall biosynthesis